MATAEHTSAQTKKILYTITDELWLEHITAKKIKLIKNIDYFNVFTCDLSKNEAIGPFFSGNSYFVIRLVNNVENASIFIRIDDNLFELNSNNSKFIAL